MINKYVSVSLKDQDLGASKFFPLSSSSFYLKYPCSDKQKCTPYIITLERGYYLFECWGSVGGKWTWENYQSTPGYGGYTSGELFIQSRTTFYVYIGNTGFFNAVKGFDEIAQNVYGAPGGATDVRLVASDNWWDTQSLISRIMVAAGGGGSEWTASIGGNGGGIVGGESTSGKSDLSYEAYPEKCPGASQTSGSTCRIFFEGANSFPGTFGSAGIPTTSDDDYGGFGGGGYYGGTSYYIAFGGSGGSSYISGHHGCNSVENSTTIKHTGSPYHYSDFVFRRTIMIPGGNTMPLPSSMEEGYNYGEGAFRLTLLFQNLQCTSQIRKCHFMQLSSLFIIVS